MYISIYHQPYLLYSCIQFHSCVSRNTAPQFHSKFTCSVLDDTPSFGCKLNQNANEGCNSCATVVQVLQDLFYVLLHVLFYFLLVIAPLSPVHTADAVDIVESCRRCVRNSQLLIVGDSLDESEH